MHRYYLPVIRSAAAENLTLSSQSPGTGMFCHSLERRKTSTFRYPGHPAAASQQNGLEDPFRLDRDPVQHDPAWPGQAFANVSALHVRHENIRNFIR